MHIPPLSSIFMVAVLAGSCTGKSAETGNSGLEWLNVLDENYPRVFFFRVAERTDRPYEEWENDMNRLMGIMGKAVDEEYRGIENRNPEYFSRFKREHPSQAVLLHFNGNARLPDYRTEKFHPGHWLYFNGATVLSGVPAGEEVSDIRVSDASLFKTHTGRYGDRNEDIGLCRLNEQGRPDWNYSEQVQLLSVDTVSNTIKVKRGCYGTEPRNFPPGKSYAAAHVHEGPWGETSDLMWLYNYSTRCPVDRDGKNCKDRLVEDLLDLLLPGGMLENFDGVEFDVLWGYLHTRWAFRENYFPGSIRAPDTNADGRGDDGVFDGVNEYTEGAMQFLRELRDGLGDDRLLTADGYHSSHIRAFGILNGMESEGWPDGNDVGINDWSGGINRHMFWDANAREPTFNFINHRWWKRGATTGAERLVMAASCLTNSAHALSDTPEGEPGGTLTPIWDELVMGQENRIGWLGKPLGPATCLAMTEPDLLNGVSPANLISRIQSDDPNVRITAEGKGVKIEGKKREQVKSIVFTIREIPCPSEDLTLYISMRGEPMSGCSPEIARLVTVGANGKSHGGGMMSYINQKTFQSVFYFNSCHTMGPAHQPVNLRFEVEGSDPFWISDIQAYAYPDARVRAFENGIVLANPAPHPHSYDLQRLFRQQEFRRLKGSPSQDPITNDGTKVKGKVELGGKDALFLIRD